MTAPLDDVTVVEIDNWMAAPSAGAILADLGATVIKIEPLGGDPMRG
ncbi:MAG: CoA transferase, partial [Pseudomonadales bacterium]|nr:CoA transferase [Pseudomonadales bacterium]